MGQVGPQLGLSWLKLGLKWTNIAIKIHLEGRSGKYTKAFVFRRENHSFGGVLGVKLAPSWDMWGSNEAMLSQAGPTWTYVGIKLEASRGKLGQDVKKWRSRGPR